MRSSILITTLALGSGLLAGGLGLTPASAQTATAAATAAGTVLSQPELYDKLEAAGYSALGKIERKPGSPIHEVRATDRHGQRLSLHIDARTGEVVKSEVKHQLPDATVARMRPAEAMHGR